MGGMLRKKLVRLLAATACGVALQACGDSGARPAPLDLEDGDKIDAGRSTGSDAGKHDAGADAGPVLGPLIEVLSPAATDDPASADVVAASTLTVRCAVTQNPKGEIVDPKSVKVAIYANEDTKAAVTQVATSTSEPDVFQAENISLASVPHGVIRIECSASDAATKVQHSEVSILSLCDQGPKVTFLNPMEKGFVAVGDGKAGIDAVVRFRVEPQPLGDQDDAAEIAEVKASVGGKPIAQLQASLTELNVYSFGVDFSDTQLFTAIPKTLSLRVDASNGRMPKPRTVAQALSVGVDSEGPTITVKSPARIGGQDPVVSGKVDVLMEIKDLLAGVNNESVVLRVEKAGGGKDTYPAQAQGNGTYVASFETGSYPGLPSLNVTLVARDNVSIETTSNLSLDIDTVPPWISLDTPTVREVNEKVGYNDCTGPFDPLGNAVTEGVVGGLAFTPRVIIWDRPLKLPNDSIPVRYAMIDDSTPRLYVQHNATVPLLVDSDGDPSHECDAINSSSEDVSKAPVPLVLSSVKPAGRGPLAGSFVTNMSTTTFVEDLDSDPSAVPLCDDSITGMEVVAELEANTRITRVIKHTARGEFPVLYADSPTTAGERLTGKAYVSGRTGWACLVATAKDNAGNFGFSPPMRVCIDGGTGICGTAPKPASCTDGCVIPSKFQADAPNAMPRLLYYRK